MTNFFFKWQFNFFSIVQFSNNFFPIAQFGDQIFQTMMEIVLGNNQKVSIVKLMVEIKPLLIIWFKFFFGGDQKSQLPIW